MPDADTFALASWSTHEERDPETRFWWLEYEPAYDSDWEELELDSAEIERVNDPRGRCQRAARERP